MNSQWEPELQWDLSSKTLFGTLRYNIQRAACTGLEETSVCKERTSLRRSVPDFARATLKEDDAGDAPMTMYAYAVVWFISCWVIDVVDDCGAFWDCVCWRRSSELGGGAPDYRPSKERTHRRSSTA